jgi:hypothetical protein
VKEASVLFPAWETFYVIVGSSAGALTGLMFVVIALVADFRGTKDQIDAFGTPNVVHFAAVLFMSSIVTAPWPTISTASAALGAFGVGHVIYVCIVLKRARRQGDYQPVLEDWMFHAILPLAAYGGILVGAVALPYRTAPLMFAIAGAALLLLFVGIHNAWDTVTYIVVKRWEERGREARR